MSCTPAQIQDLQNRVNAAAAAGDFDAAFALLNELQACLENAGSDGLDKGTLDGGYETLNPALNPSQPHGDQHIQRSYWNLRGSRCGRCTSCPRYWKLTFDFSYENSDATFADLFGVSFSDHKPPLPEGADPEVERPNAPYWDYRNWFEDISSPGSPGVWILKRGKMAFPPIGGDSGSFDEAMQARADLEYDKCFWKRRIPLRNEPLDLTAGNGLNAAWFLHFEFIGVDAGWEINKQLDSFINPETFFKFGWLLSVIENQRQKPTSAGGGAWTNSYAPLVEYQLVPPYRQPYDTDLPDNPAEDEYPYGNPRPRATFNCLGRNVFEAVLESLSTYPKHTAILEPFWP